MSIDKTQPIVTLTPAALAHIKKFVSELSEEAGFRIAIKKTGCSGYAYLVDVIKDPKANDIVFKQDVNLFIDLDAVNILKGTVVDYLEKETGQKQLIFNNPNAEDFCGCGESFTLKEDV